MLKHPYYHVVQPPREVTQAPILASKRSYDESCLGIHYSRIVCPINRVMKELTSGTSHLSSHRVPHVLDWRQVRRLCWGRTLLLIFQSTLSFTHSVWANISCSNNISPSCCKNGEKKFLTTVHAYRALVNWSTNTEYFSQMHSTIQCSRGLRRMHKRLSLACM